MAKEIKMSVPVPPDLHKKLKALARKDGRVLSRYVAKVMEAHVAEKATANA